MLKKCIKYPLQIIVSSISLVSALLLASEFTLAQPRDFIDRSTQYEGMHICGDSAYMQGVHVSRNEFVCIPPSSSALNRTFLNDIVISGQHTSRTQYRRDGKTIHTCPNGYGMRGLHVSNNWLACAPITLTDSGLVLSQPFLDYGTQRDGRHVCNDNGIMIGIHVSDNILVCRSILQR